MDTVVRSPSRVTARLLLSLSGISDDTVERCAQFSAEMADRGVPLSLLVAARPPAGLGQAALWVAQQCGRGAALLLHGYDQVAPPGAAWLGGRRAEFAVLPAHEAGLRLTAATAVLERHGLRTDLFAPPRWLASSGTLLALRRRGFAQCATAGAVRDLATDRVRRGRVLGFGFGGVPEPWRCRALVLGVAGYARRGGSLLRLAVDAGELARSGPRQAVLDSVDIALHHGATAVTYQSLVDGGARRGRSRWLVA